ncbi:hypothetical protein SZ64_00955 [Erythrobacter sp. SG61-1L]|nr:hypothetical protein SZ64_00955 [Erythrobacter sp. SG61-1L]
MIGQVLAGNVQFGVLPRQHYRSERGRKDKRADVSARGTFPGFHPPMSQSATLRYRGSGDQ